MSTTATIDAPVLPARGASALGPTVARVLGVVAFARAAQFVEVLLFPLVAATRGAGTVGAAFVLLCLALGATAGSLAGGMLVDRGGPRRVAAAALALSSIAAFALAVGAAVPTLAAAAGLYGAASAVWRLALETATAHALADDGGEEEPQAARERAFGAFIWLVNVGALLSAVAVAAGIGARAGVAAQAVLHGTAAVSALTLLRPTRPLATEGSGLRGSIRPFVVFAIACAPFTIVTFQGFSGLAALFEESDYRIAVLVNAVTLVAFPILLWRVFSRIDGLHAILVGAGVQGGGIAVGASLADPIFAIVLFSSGQAMLMGVIPAVVAGVAPHAATGRYRAAFSTVQGAAASGAIFAGPLIAEASPTLFALTMAATTAVGLAAVATQRSLVDLGLRQPVACPCGALSCTCTAGHLSCALPVADHGSASRSTRWLIARLSGSRAPCRFSAAVLARAGPRRRPRPPRRPSRATPQAGATQRDAIRRDILEHAWKPDDRRLTRHHQRRRPRRLNAHRLPATGRPSIARKKAPSALRARPPACGGATGPARRGDGGSHR